LFKRRGETNSGKEEEKEEILKAGIHNKAQISVMFFFYARYLLLELSFSSYFYKFAMMPFM
jgi:hypothetical protein